MNSKRFGQGFDQGHQFFSQHSRDQPSKWRFIEGIEKMQWHQGGHPILLMAGFKAVLKRDADGSDLTVVWKINRIEGRIHLDGNVISGELQQPWILRLTQFPPFLKGNAADDICWDPLVKETGEPSLIDQKIDAATFLLKVIRLFQKLEIVKKERRPALIVHLHEGMADEHLAGFFGIHPFVGDLSS